jgi:uncharacterized protein
MRHETFVDSAGLFAVLVKGEPMHRRANDLLKHAVRLRRRFVTTDYVLDETATLLKVRGHGHLCLILFETVFDSAACRVEWMDPERFMETRRFFLKRHDQDWSFTDCFSFWLMRELRLRDALTTDAHFREAGFNPLLV